MDWVIPVAGLFCVLGMASVAISAYALHLAVQTRIEIKAFQNSTHKVQFVPLDPSSDKELNDLLDRGESSAFGKIDDIHEEYQHPLI